MLEELKEKVFYANKKLVQDNLVILTWGNASAFDYREQLLVIKPSGIPYDIMQSEDMVIVDLDGKVMEGSYKPSSDTPTHVEMYRKWGDRIQGIVHTHSTYATAWAQSGLDIPIQGTTHADYFYGNIPCLGVLTEEQVTKNYEYYTGIKIVSEFEERSINPLEMGACLLTGHGPFTWGKTVDKAVENALVLETVAKMGLSTLLLDPNIMLPNYVMDKHYLRKHGKNSYYGQ